LLFAHNAWKLAQRLSGAAGDGLLDSYEAERLPVARFTAEQAFTRYVTRSAPWLQVSPPLAPLAPDFDVEVGYVYHSGGCAGGGPMGHADPSATHGALGTRLPHVWVEKGGRRTSTLDLGSAFVVLAGPQGARWCDAARTMAAPMVDAYAIGQDVIQPKGGLTTALGIGESGATLVRPDGFVAWRATALTDQPHADLSAALDRILGRIGGHEPRV
jgi:putative polyketide hydroxylase